MDDKNTKGTHSPKIEQPTSDKPVSAPQTQALTPEMLKAIQEIVSASVGEVMKQVVAQPQAQTPSTAATVGTDASGLPLLNPRQPPKQSVYKTRLQGIPVEEGQDLRHVHPARISAWFQNVEQRWKQQMNDRKVSGSAVNLGWTRG